MTVVANMADVGS